MKSWSLRKKIWGLIGLLSFSFIGSTLYTLKNLAHLRDSLNEVTGRIVRSTLLASEIKDNQRRVSYLTTESIALTKPEQLKMNQNGFQALLEKQNKDFNSFKEIASEKEKALLDEYMIINDHYVTGMIKTRELSFQNKKEEASTVFVETREKWAKKMAQKLKELGEINATILAEKTTESNADAGRTLWLGVIISSFSITSTIVIAFFFLHFLTKAITTVVRSLSESSTQVTQAATQIASSSEELSQAATEQAASLEETAASVEEMNSMVNKNSENARSTAQMSHKSQDAVSQGQEVVKKMTESMEKINSSSEGMAEIVKVIEQIDKKTKIIHEIVNKTELLSFNASVEAARAGEHGKGFAVVAEEVGNLARMSGSAAEEIGSLLMESVTKVNQMVQDTKGNVSIGTRVTLECAEVFQEIVRNVSNVSRMATEIASASEEQSRGISEITKAMNQLDQMTQQNASTSEECAATAEELSAQAESLKKAVNLLISTINGGSESTTLPSPALDVQEKELPPPQKSRTDQDLSAA